MLSVSVGTNVFVSQKNESQTTENHALDSFTHIKPIEFDDVNDSYVFPNRDNFDILFIHPH